MTENEARGIITDYYLAESHSADDKFLFVEAQHYLIDTFHDPVDMHNLAWFYAEERNFGLYRKYLEMAAEYGFLPAFESLGYFWYYGQSGTVDYEKAFYCFCRGAESLDDYLRIGCEYKIADMYRYGYFVEKDEDKYKEMIERLYDEVSNPRDLVTIMPTEFLPDPGLCYRLAEIRADEGRTDEAMELLKEARMLFAKYLHDNPSWWGNIDEMESVVMMMHDLSLNWDGEIDLYDLFWLSVNEGTMTFRYNGIPFTVECIPEGRNIVIRFNNKWYRDLHSFFEKAKIGGRPITAIYEELTDYEVA